MGYYRGTMKRVEASSVQIGAGTRISDLRFAVHQQNLYTVELIPPGHYVVTIYVEPDFQTESIPKPHASGGWQSEKLTSTQVQKYCSL
jgi:hypothetical protein